MRWQTPSPTASERPSRAPRSRRSGHSRAFPQVGDPPAGVARHWRLERRLRLVAPDRLAAPCRSAAGRPGPARSAAEALERFRHRSARTSPPLSPSVFSASGFILGIASIEEVLPVTSPGTGWRLTVVDAEEVVDGGALDRAWAVRRLWPVRRRGTQLALLQRQSGLQRAALAAWQPARWQGRRSGPNTHQGHRLRSCCRSQAASSRATHAQSAAQACNAGSHRSVHDRAGPSAQPVTHRRSHQRPR
jgi:hypothetical protein